MADRGLREGILAQMMRADGHLGKRHMSRPGNREKLGGGRLKVRVKTGKGRTQSQKAWLERQLNDPYVHEARKLGYRSRAAFKLIEIDDSITSSSRWPGGRPRRGTRGWSQVAAKRVKSEDGKGKVIAIDMHGMDELPGVTILRKTFSRTTRRALLISALGGEKADCVISDMAAMRQVTARPTTSRSWLAEAGHMFAPRVLKPGGTYLARCLRGGTKANC